MFYFKYNTDLLLAYELQDGEDGWGHVVRLDGNTLSQKWLTDIPGFNVGQGLVENNFLYLTAIGFAAKLDLESGKYAWRHDGLYKPGFYNAVGLRESGYFNDFEQPRLEGNVILFPESKPYTEHKETERPAVTLRFDKNTGKPLKRLISNFLVPYLPVFPKTG